MQIVNVNNKENENYEEKTAKGKYSNTEAFKIYSKEVNKYKVLSQSETMDMFSLLKNGNEEEKKYARDLLVCSNLRIVIGLAFNFNDSLISVEDLIQIGNFSLIKAVDNFQLNKTDFFYNYAYTCIKFEMISALNRAVSHFHISKHDLDHVRKIEKVVSEFKALHNREPEDEEIMNIINITPSSLRFCKTNSIICESLDSIIYKQGTNFSHTLDNKNESCFSLKLEHEIINDLLLRFIINMDISENEKYIIFWSYGLNNTEVMSQREIGELLGLSQVAVCRKKMRVIKKLKNDNIFNAMLVNFNESELSVEEKNKCRKLYSEETNCIINTFYDKLNTFKSTEIKNNNEVVETELLCESNTLNDENKISDYIHLLIRKKDIITLEKFLNSNFDSNKLCFKLINFYISNEDYEKAILLSNQFPLDINIQLLILRFYIKNNRFDDYINVAKNFPEQEKVQVNLCKIYCKKGEYELAYQITNLFLENECLQKIRNKLSYINDNINVVNTEKINYKI